MTAHGSCSTPFAAPAAPTRRRLFTRWRRRAGSARAASTSFSTDKEPAWHYHQFLKAPLTIIQYTEQKQPVDAAPILWPRALATVDYVYKPPA